MTNKNAENIFSKLAHGWDDVPHSRRQDVLERMAGYVKTNAAYFDDFVSFLRERALFDCPVETAAVMTELAAAFPEQMRNAKTAAARRFENTKGNIVEDVFSSLSVAAVRSILKHGYSRARLDEKDRDIFRNNLVRSENPLVLEFVLGMVEESYEEFDKESKNAVAYGLLNADREKYFSRLVCFADAFGESVREELLGSLTKLGEYDFLDILTPNPEIFDMLDSACDGKYAEAVVQKLMEYAGNRMFEESYSPRAAKILLGQYVARRMKRRDDPGDMFGIPEKFPDAVARAVSSDPILRRCAFARRPSMLDEQEKEGVVAGIISNNPVAVDRFLYDSLWYRGLGVPFLSVCSLLCARQGKALNPRSDGVDFTDYVYEMESLFLNLLSVTEDVDSINVVGEFFDTCLAPSAEWPSESKDKMAGALAAAMISMKERDPGEYPEPSL